MEWVAGIRRIEKDDPVEGGEDGISNIQAKQLAARTNWLKQQVEAAQGDMTAHLAAADPHAQYATEVWVSAQLDAVIEGAPGSLNTLNELAAAMGDDPNFAATVINQLALKAPLASPVFTGDPKAPTAPQFDADQSLANTAFVQRALGNLSGVTGVNANTVLTAAHAGQLISLFGTGAFTVTLPLGSTVPVGTALQFFSSQSPGNVALVRQGADLISVAANTVTGLTLWAGDSVTLVWSGSAWTAWGEMQLPHSPMFGASLNTNGYRKLPSGEIEQWGILNIPTGVSTSQADVTFPFPFPVECISFVASIGIGIANYDEVAGHRACRQDVSYGYPTRFGCEGQAFIDNFTGHMRIVQWRAKGR